MKTVVEKLFENADRHPDKLAVVFENEEVTYSQLKDAVIRLSSWFKLHGIEKGDRIVAQAAYCKWFIAAYYAAHLCGAIIVPVEKTLTQETLEGVVKRMDAKAAVSWLEPVALVSLNYGDAEDALADIEVQPYTFPDLDLVANIIFTSGTTGIPKGAMLTQRNLSKACEVRMHEMNIIEDDVDISFTPLNHVGATRILDTILYYGRTYIALDGIIKIKVFYTCIEKYHVTSAYFTPSGLAAVERLSQDKLHDYAKQFDYIYIGSSAIQAAQVAFLDRVLPESRLFYVYASSENGTVTITRLDRDRRDAYCVGRPCEGVEIRILDDSMNELPLGQRGRVAIRTEMNFKGYWAMPELTASVYYGDWFLTNDAGYLDGDGCLYILGRVDDVINIGGLKVHPSEIENAALEIDGVEECLCVDMSNALTGSAARLLVRPGEGAALTARDIRMALTKKLDTYKVPASIEMVEEIRKNAIGKPDRKYYRTQE